MNEEALSGISHANSGSVELSAGRSRFIYLSYDTQGQGGYNVMDPVEVLAGLSRDVPLLVRAAKSSCPTIIFKHKGTSQHTVQLYSKTAKGDSSTHTDNQTRIE